MRTARIVVLVVLVCLTITACGVVGGYNEKNPVSIQVTAAARLNDYSGEPHALVVYAYKVDDPDLFLGADEASLIADVGKPVAGGVVHRSQTFSPGDNGVNWGIGAMGQERYRWVGVYAAYRDAAGARRMVVEIPRSAKLVLDLGAKGIDSFREQD